MEIDLQENPWITWLSLTVIVMIALVGFAFVGRNVTPADNPRVITWSDWQTLQARRAYNEELSALREDLNAIVLAFQFPPDPVSAQILQTRILQHTQSGQPALELSRAHLQNAADGMVAWAGGQITGEEMSALLQLAGAALK